MNEETGGVTPEGAQDQLPPDPDSLNTSGLLELIDYTLLKPEVTIEGYSVFVREAEKWGFHSVFVPSAYVPLAEGLLESSPVVVGTPVSFPFGYGSTEAKVAEAMTALEDGARELDVVMNVSMALSGQWDMVEEDLAAVVALAREWEKLYISDKVVVKVILETPYLDDRQKREACARAVSAGMDFVKTATGLGPGGATVSDVALMREAVGPDVGVKAAGGVRTWAEARAMIEAGANRIGASTGPSLVEDFIRARG